MGLIPTNMLLNRPFTPPDMLSLLLCPDLVWIHILLEGCVLIKAINVQLGPVLDSVPPVQSLCKAFARGRVGLVLSECLPRTG